jgi:DNA mismatch repair protein MutL
MFNLPASTSRQRIVNIFRVKQMKSLCPRRNGDCNHKGFVSKPEFAKKSRGEQFFLLMIDSSKVVICIMR